ncbi:hypothetical protein SAMN05444280_105151 [Tangfeifania diversioriginum]|uniref:Uncharacterized protein n=1 Tax=Tangfeifania diversioriginum TaxID=1168035 RepID=A0A1M6DQZ0_9BACT|nr:hypothetical protein [Tangfeifania diversioriginum]SHI75642.1 hypothetical protein SAMN05444280_105151 [Tangfeifania diversioriginum]
MKIVQRILVLFLMVCYTGVLVAQDNVSSHKLNIEVPEVALLGLVSENASDISFSASSPTEAGNAIDFHNNKNQNNHIWLNYSSVINNSTHRRKIVAFVQGEMPKGMHLKVKASEAEGSGKGKLGHPAGEILLSDKPAEIISGIGSCYTGKGVNNGHVLTYELEYDQDSPTYAGLSTEPTTFNVIYTLTDHN